MSRRHQLMRTPLTLVTLLVACCAAVSVLAGCGAGQVTQTDSQVAVIDGTDGDVGDIALRDVLIPYPDSTHGRYPPGSDVPLRFTIVNQAGTADKLMSVTTPVSGQVQLEGSTTIPAGMSVVSPRDPERVDSATEGTEDTGQDGSPGLNLPPVSPLDFGELRIVLADIDRELRPGRNVEVTFVFQDAGSVTLPVPMGPPTESERTPLEEGGHS